jgi:hypothetical protein
MVDNFIKLVFYFGVIYKLFEVPPLLGNLLTREFGVESL